MTQPNNTTDSELEKQLADILGWWKARRKHIRWMGETYDSDAEPKDKEMAAVINLLAQEANKAVLAALAKHVLAGMPELTPRQQDYIMRVFEKLTAESKHAQRNDLVAADRNVSTDAANPPQGGVQ